jgi:AcrR family transcriptional regulator
LIPKIYLIFAAGKAKIMAKNQKNGITDASTEEKIKNAARTVFHKKGYAATRTRDIAEEAGINLALLNYYFRSKEKLFEIIMFETLTAFSQGMIKIMNDENTDFEKKIEEVVINYVNMLTKEPNIPMFILSEIRNHPQNLLEKLPVRALLANSVFVKQFNKKAMAGQIKEPKLLHFMMNLLGTVIFPFIGQPFLMALGGLDDSQFNELIQERKRLIPLWIKAMSEAE